LTACTIKILLALLVLISSAADLHAREWEGIVPLHSTRQDVAKYSAQCASAKTRCQFSTATAEVLVVFSGGGVAESATCPKVAVGTVLLIEVRPYNRTMSVREVVTKGAKYRSFNPSSPKDKRYKTYYYYKEGILVTTFEHKIVKMHYVASKEDLHLCPEYYANLKNAVAIGLSP
jgi:hypothetical protein